MKHSMLMFAAGLVLCCTAQAQTTYTTDALGACIGAQHTMTWTTSGTGCPANGSPNTLTDADGNFLWLRFSLYTNSMEISYWPAGQNPYLTPSAWSGSGPLTLSTFTNPSGCVYAPQQTPCAVSGTITFGWSMIDNLGNPRTGTYTTSWDSRAVFRWTRQFLIPPTQVLTIN